MFITETIICLFPSSRMALFRPDPNFATKVDGAKKEILNKKITSPASVPGGEKIPCFECKRGNGIGATGCFHCGVSLIPIDVPQFVSASDQMAAELLEAKKVVVVIQIYVTYLQNAIHWENEYIQLRKQMSQTDNSNLQETMNGLQAQIIAIRADFDEAQEQLAQRNSMLKRFSDEIQSLNADPKKKKILMAEPLKGTLGTGSPYFSVTKSWRCPFCNAPGNSFQQILCRKCHTKVEEDKRIT